LRRSSDAAGEFSLPYSTRNEIPLWAVIDDRLVLVGVVPANSKTGKITICALMDLNDTITAHACGDLNSQPQPIPRHRNRPLRLQLKKSR